MAFISDASGINNIYITIDENDSAIPITNIITGTTQLNWTSNNQLIFTGFYKSGYDIFLLSNIERLVLNTENIKVAKWKIKKDLPILKNYSSTNESNNKYSNFIFNENNINSQKYQIDDVDESLLKDTSNYYIKNDYNTRFTLDLAQAYYSYDSYYGSQGMAMFLFSDILGDHRIGVSTEMQIDLKESDYFFYYRYLKNRINHQVMFYHQAYRSDAIPIENYSVDYTLNRNVGINYMFHMPFSRFSRIEGGIIFDHLIKEELTLQVNGDEITNNYYSYNLLRPNIKYVWDNTRWFYLYPVSGNRTYFNYEIVPKSSFNDYFFEKFTMDSRTYFELSFTNKISFASRIYFGASWGKDKRLFGLGGAPYIFSNDNNDMVNSDFEAALPREDDFYFMNNFIFPVRGFPMAQKYGNKALLMNYELRLPFLMYYFPTIKYLGQLFGVIFIDMGVAWSDEFPKFRDAKNWSQNENNSEINPGWIMSYGFGPRFVFLNMAWKLDYARQYNPVKGDSSNRNWYLTIGYDF